jgi:hypothetical protein
MLVKQLRFAAPTTDQVAWDPTRAGQGILSRGDNLPVVVQEKNSLSRV